MHSNKDSAHQQNSKQIPPAKITTPQTTIHQISTPLFTSSPLAGPAHHLTLKIQQMNQLIAAIKKLKFSGLLSPHKINNRHRAKLCDWILTVVNHFDQQIQTYFRTIQILDMYLTHTKERIRKRHLHDLGVVCVLIASKQEEVRQLRLNQLVGDGGEDKARMSELLKLEIQVLGVIGWQTGLPTVFEAIRTCLGVVDFKSTKEHDFALNSAVYIA